MSNFIEDMQWRRAVKKFNSEKKLSSDQLNMLLESLRLSPSSFGCQFWKFVVIEDMEVKRKLYPFTNNQSQILDASHVIVLCRKTSISEKDIESYVELISKTRNVALEDLEKFKHAVTSSIKNKTSQDIDFWLAKQVYIALGVLLASCAVHRIDSCPMEGFSTKDYDNVLKLSKQNLKSTVVCTVGFRHEKDKYSSLSKVRFPQENVVIKI